MQCGVPSCALCISGIGAERLQFNLQRKGLVDVKVSEKC